MIIIVGGTLDYQEGVKGKVAMLVIPFTGQEYRNGYQGKFSYHNLDIF